MPENTVNLVVPGLLNTFTKAEIDQLESGLPGMLPSVLSRADLVDIPAMPIDLAYQSHLSLGFYQSQIDADIIDSGFHLFYVDPLFLQIQTDHILAKKADFNVDTITISNLLKSLNAHFKEDDLQFGTFSNGQIYCLVKENCHVELTPYGDILGRDIKHFLPGGNDAGFWIKLFNEVQMFLHQYTDTNDINLNFNGLWFWGGTDILDRNIAPVLVGDNDWVKGYSSYYQLPQIGIKALESVTAENFTVIDERFLEPSSIGDFKAWKRQLAGFELEVLNPLLNMLRSGNVKRLLLHKSDKVAYRINKKQRLRLFRKKLSVHQICATEL